jgi:hypothetical protein
MVELTLVIVGSTALLAYALYVWSLVQRADFYSVAQKALQAVLVVAIPLFGALVVHYLYRVQVNRPPTGGRAFTPQGPIMDSVSQAQSLKDET